MRKLVTILTLLFPFWSYALEEVILTDGAERFEVWRNAEIISVERGTTPDLEGWLKGDGNFTGFVGHGTNASDWEMDYYIRFSISNKSYSRDQFFIEAFDPKISDISLIYMDEGKVKSVDQGAALDFDSKGFQHKNFLFFLPLDRGETGTFLMKMSGYRTVSFKVVVRSSQAFINYSLAEYMFMGIFVGLILMIVVVNINLFSSTGHRTYLYYILFVFNNIMFPLSLTGIGFQYLWPFAPSFNQFASPIFACGLSVTLLVYITSFLNSKETEPKFYQAAKWVIIARVIFLILGLFISEIRYLTTIDTIPFLLAFVLCLRAYRKKVQGVKYLLIGFFCLFGGFMIYTAWFNGLIQPIVGYGQQPLLVYSYEIASVFEMFFFSAAISSKLKFLEREKASADKELIVTLREKEELTQKVNRELEQKVQERTVELNKKNDELLEANEKLQELTDQANEFNIQLDLQNRKLTQKTKETIKAKLFMKEASQEEFDEVFPDDLSCYRTLERLKWEGGFECIRCGHDQYAPGTAKYARRCVKCNYEESATVNTLFHRLRFPIRSAFFMLYFIRSKDGNVTVDKLQELTGLRRATCWSFRKKVIEAMEVLSSKKKGSKLTDWEQLVLFNPKELKSKSK